MLSSDSVLKLSQLRSPLLTVYLDVSCERSFPSAPSSPCLTWLKAQANVIAEHVPAEELPSFWREVQRVGSTLQNSAPLRAGLIIFSGPDAGEQIFMDVPICNEMHWGRPAIGQLLSVIGVRQPSCVLVVDRSRARFFRYWLGELKPLEEIIFVSARSTWKRKDLGHVETPGIKKTRGSQRDAFEHRREAEYQRWHRHLGERATAWCRKEASPWLFLAGSKRQTEEISKALPSDLRRHASFLAADLGPMRPIAIKRLIAPKIESRAAEQSDRQLTDLLEGGGGSVMGVDATMFQLQARRMDSVLLAEGFDSDLHECESCGLVARSADPVCVACGHARRRAALSEVLPGLAANCGARLEVIGREAGRRLARAGGIGGWLRKERLAAHG